VIETRFTSFYYTRPYTVLIYLYYTMILIYYIVIIVVRTHGVWWVVFYALVHYCIIPIMGGRASNPRSEIPVRRPHADANRPGDIRARNGQEKRIQPFWVFFPLLFYKCPRREGTVTTTAVQDGEGSTKRTIQLVHFVMYI